MDKRVWLIWAAKLRKGAWDALGHTRERLQLGSAAIVILNPAQLFSTL